jgi:rod shape-determining protein MreC
VAVYRRTTRPRYTLLLLVLTSITLITLDYRGAGGGVIESIRRGATDAFAPVESAADSVLEPVGNFFQGMFNYGDLEAENARLRAALAEAEGRVARADDADRERRRLLDLQDLDFVENIPTVSARVVSTSPSNFDLTVQIDRGTDDGVAKGMPVVTGAGLVGRITAVSRTRSTVLLVTDPTSSVGIRLTKSGDVGVATGRGAGRNLGVDLIALDAAVDKGEVVVTSGLQQSVFPPSIPVGRVEEARNVEGDFEKEVRIRPVVDLRRLTFVKVLQWSPQ